MHTADRVQKLKDARSEAEKEIEQYKKMKEQEFKAFEDSVRPHLHPALPPPNCSLPLQHAGNTQAVQAAIDKETEVKLT